MIGSTAVRSQNAGGNLSDPFRACRRSVTVMVVVETVFALRNITAVFPVFRGDLGGVKIMA